MKLPNAAALLVLSSVAWAQAPLLPIARYQPLQQLKEFLQLSDSQARTILENNEEYNRWAFEKQRRIQQVQAEIAEETRKEPIDPGALGIRYAEIETNCRQMRDRAAELRKRNLDVLNPDQRAKLKVLEDAIKLGPVIAEAQSGNLIGEMASAPVAFLSGGATGGIIGGILGPANGCSLPFPVLRTGGLVFTAGRAQPQPDAPLRWFDTATSQNPR